MKLYTLRYFTPYTKEWRVVTFTSYENAKRMLDFYLSCGTPATLQ